MREREIKILWGRSGNRCAICKLELTPDGTKETLGEMAHIVAKSHDGPRGDSDLPDDERDHYNNLILLCPTHHTEIDKNKGEWAVEKLADTKLEHEKWVSKKLETGDISIKEIDNSEFLNHRKDIWQTLGIAREAVVVSITPLSVEDEILDPLDQSIITLINNSLSPVSPNEGENVNHHNTRPTENGIANIFQPKLDRVGWGYALEIFRNGHCEYFVEQADSADQITENVIKRGNDVDGADSILRYTDVADSIYGGIMWLINVWDSTLPYKYMTVTASLVNIANTNMFSFEGVYEVQFGFSIESPRIEYSDVISNETNREELSFQILQRFVNSYGLMLTSLFNKDGEFTRPTLIRD